MSSIPTAGRLASCLASCLALLSHGVVAATPTFSEIHYQPAGTNVLAEWIELHNPTATTLDLSGWRFTRGVTFTFPSPTTLQPGGYLVVAAHRPTFESAYPDVTNVVGNWSGTLDDDGESLELQDPTRSESIQLHYGTEGDWTVRRLAAPDRYGKVGWEWSAPHKGGGHSMERVSFALPADHGQNWTSSPTVGGTPGRPNASATNDAAPLLLSPRHWPAVPTSTEPVTVTLRVLDDHPGSADVRLLWRHAADAPFEQVPMLDDGRNGDGLPGDGLFGARIPALTNTTLVEFHFTAADTTGHVRILPHVEPSFANRSPWFVYQVDDGRHAGAQPLHRLVAPALERAYLEKEVWSGSPLSDATINGTLITADGQLSEEGTPQVRYLVGFRNRGHGTRYSTPHNFRVEIPNDRPWRGRTGINLNSQFTPIQNLGSAVFRALGVPIAESTRVELRWNSVNLASTNAPQWGAYAANEVIDGNLARRQVPDDPDGNLYQGVRDFNTAITPNLAWHGPLPTAYTNAYFKENHRLTDDWSDLIHLIDVLNNTPDSTYADAIRDTIDVDEWLRYFAIHTFLDNQETTLGTGVGDDYVLYFPTRSRKAQLWSYDMDSLLGSGTRTVATANGLFRAAAIPAIARFLRHPAFAPAYHRHLQDLGATFFEPARFNHFLDSWSLQLPGTPGLEPLLHNLKAYNASRWAVVQSLLPGQLAVTNLPAVVSGFPRVLTGTLRLAGTADAARTAAIHVNGSPASYSPWEGTWSHPDIQLNPGINRLLLEATDDTGARVGSTNFSIWFDSTPTSRGGTLANSQTWSAANSPHLITNSLTIPSGVTLTIEAGTTLFLASGANITISNGGQLIAEGRPEAPITFTRPPGATTPWGGITLAGDANSPETRFAHAHIEGNGTTAIHSTGGTLLLDHVSFGTTDRQYLSLDASSFIVRDCHFPATTAAIEPLHGTGGIRPGGHGILCNSFIGSPQGYSDSFDFSGGNRPGQPILHIIGNVFAGSGDDGLDLDGTDAWVEGNIFLRIHRNGAPDSSAAVSGGNGGGATSEITIINNLFFDTDNVATSKQGNFYTLLHNTIVRTTREGGVDFASGIVNLRDTTPDVTTYGRGTYLEGNIITDAESLIRNPLESLPSTFNNNLLPFPWTGAGTNNRVLDPLLTRIPTPRETTFNSRVEALALWDWFKPQPASPAIDAGIQGRTLGASPVPGAFISGEPETNTTNTTATLVVGPNRSGSGIPTDGFPDGSGYVAYRWRLDAGPWSSEIPIHTPIHLDNLTPGSHVVEVSGKRDSGLFQDDPLFGPDAQPTRSRPWSVVPVSTPPRPNQLRLNEVLAANNGTFTNAGSSPDLVELFNPSDASIDLGGISLSDDPADPRRFSFPPGTALAPRSFLVLFADSRTNLPGIHLGFGLDADGDAIFLTDAPSRGGTLIDSVSFGPQVADASIGRTLTGIWTLCQPTPGTHNIARRLGSTSHLFINEWLASTRFAAANDFIELFNDDPAPVALAGLQLSDATTQPDRFLIPALSFIAPFGHVRFLADGDSTQGPSHLPFRLSADHGLIHLADQAGRRIDVVAYGPQRTDASQGRSPDGGPHTLEFNTPTPAGPNPGNDTVECTVAVQSLPFLGFDSTWSFNLAATLDGIPWTEPGFDDSTWPTGPGLLGVESCNCLPAPGIRTPLQLGRITYYFRTHFLIETNLAGFTLTLSTILDDGALIYLNGTLVAAPGMSTNGVTAATRSSRNVDDATVEHFQIPLSALVWGTNVLAVEVHQTSSSSSDLVWGAALEASRSITNCTPVATTTVRFNEVLARNLTLTNADGLISDWIEIHNTSTNFIPLDDLSLSDTPANPRRWIFPGGTTLPPLGFLTLRCSPLLPPGPGIVPLSLDASGGTLFLYDAPARGGSLLDSLTYGFQAPDFAIGRVPDGAPSWTLTVPTEARPNMPAALGDPSALRINEWMADPVSGADWFELFNTGPTPVALDGFFLTDDLDSPFASRIPPLSYIGVNSGAYRLFLADGNTAAGAHHVSFNLRRAGEALGLYAPSGQLLDGVLFQAQTTGVSQGRFPDGTFTVQSFPTSPSPGSPNRLAPTADTDLDGLPDTWESAFGLDPGNPADAALDTDNDGASNLAEFRAGTHPRDATDVLALEIRTEPTLALQFRAAPNRSYSIEFTDEVTNGSWTPLQVIPAQATPTITSLPIAAGEALRLYRILTPARAP